MNEERYGLFQINNNPNSDMDIIFIHGLGGDKFTTWENEKNESWQKWLAQDHNVSVWSIAYGANKTNWIEDDMSLDATADFMLGTLTSQGIGKKPYMFVVHSLGGLLAKKILLKANVHGEYKELLDMCKSIIFFAVPHTGSGWANLLNFGKPLLRNSKVLTALPKGTDELHNLAINFNAIIIKEEIETYVFYETKEIRAKGLLSLFHLNKGIVIVSQESATQIHSTNQKVPLPADHLSICKIESKDSDLYKNKIRTIIEKTMDTSTQIQENEIPNQNTIGSQETPVTMSHSGSGDIVYGDKTENSIIVEGDNSAPIIIGNNNKF